MSAVTDKHVKEQCRRLSSVPLANPQSAEGKQEIADVLRRHCDSNDHVTATITKFLENEEGLQNPIAALVRIARKIREATIEETKSPMGCAVCQGTGWYHFEKMVYPGGCNPYMADYCTFCSCEAGQWRKTKVRERQAK